MVPILSKLQVFIVRKKSHVSNDTIVIILKHMKILLRQNSISKKDSCIPFLKNILKVSLPEYFVKKIQFSRFIHNRPFIKIQNIAIY